MHLCKHPGSQDLVGKGDIKTKLERAQRIPPPSTLKRVLYGSFIYAHCTDK